MCALRWRPDRVKVRGRLPDADGRLRGPGPDARQRDQARQKGGAVTVDVAIGKRYGRGSAGRRSSTDGQSVTLTPAAGTPSRVRSRCDLALPKNVKIR